MRIGDSTDSGKRGVRNDNGEAKQLQYLSPFDIYLLGEGDRQTLTSIGPPLAGRSLRSRLLPCQWGPCRHYGAPWSPIRRGPLGLMHLSRKILAASMRVRVQIFLPIGLCKLSS